MTLMYRLLIGRPAQRLLRAGKQIGVDRYQSEAASVTVLNGGREYSIRSAARRETLTGRLHITRWQ